MESAAVTAIDAGTAMATAIGGAILTVLGTVALVKVLRRAF